MRHEIRLGLILAAAMTVMSATAARADQWCGYATHQNAVIQCGYTTASDCENAVGKGGMCFVDPDVALNTKAAAPANSTKIPPRS
jgi:hypothetical protein